LYPKVYGLNAWSDNCKWYSSVPLGAVVSLEIFAAITLYVASQRVFIVVSIYFVIESVRNHLDTPSYNCSCKEVLKRVRGSERKRTGTREEGDEL
jgi:hypothetical protein